LATLYIRDVPEEFHRKVKAAAALRGLTIQQLVVEALKAYIEGKEVK
jgi:plasmid stability protein